MRVEMLQPSTPDEYIEQLVLRLLDLEKIAPTEKMRTALSAQRKVAPALVELWAHLEEKFQQDVLDRHEPSMLFFRAIACVAVPLLAAQVDRREDLVAATTLLGDLVKGELVRCAESIALAHRQTAGRA